MVIEVDDHVKHVANHVVKRVVRAAEASSQTKETEHDLYLILLLVFVVLIFGRLLRGFPHISHRQLDRHTDR